MKILTFSYYFFVILIFFVNALWCYAFVCSCYISFKFSFPICCITLWNVYTKMFYFVINTTFSLLYLHITFLSFVSFIACNLWSPGRAKTSMAIQVNKQSVGHPKMEHVMAWGRHQTFHSYIDLLHLLVEKSSCAMYY